MTNPAVYPFVSMAAWVTSGFSGQPKSAAATAFQLYRTAIDSTLSADTKNTLHRLMAKASRRLAMNQRCKKLKKCAPISFNTHERETATI